MRRVPLLFAAVLTTLLIAPTPAPASDVDGPDDCGRWIDDYGDAPEGIPAYPSGVLGRFPTCITPGPVGTQTSFCPPISTPPGPAGFVHHLIVVPDPHYWLGCYGVPGAALGIDSEPDGKVNTPSVGMSACVPGLLTDCVQPAWGTMFFDQDECYTDGSDAGVTAPPALAICTPATLAYNAYNACPTPAPAFLNILIDMNGDGDWNDNFGCGTSCAYEWAVKNVPITLAVGCNALISPSFLVGPNPGPGWMRVSLSNDPMPDDFPWNGTVSLPGQLVRGGETEDYPVSIDQQTPTRPSNWGRLKLLYRPAS